MATAVKGSQKKAAPRSKRFEFRVSQREQALISRAAAEKGMTMTGFVIESARHAAEAVLADQRQFELPAAKFVEFLAALDRPARVVPAVKRLFEERSVLERDRQKAAAV